MTHRALLDLVRERTGPRFPDFTALWKAYSNPRQLADVLGRGVDPDSISLDGSSLLHRSDLTLDTVRLLLAAGADPDVRWFDRSLRTPLFFATTEGVPTALYQAGADLEHRDSDGLTPLLFNVEYGCLPMIEELLTLGANWKATDLQGLGFADYATLATSPAAVQQLMLIHSRLKASERRRSLLAQLPDKMVEQITRRM
jgi:ankyrin repeat protein